MQDTTTMTSLRQRKIVSLEVGFNYLPANHSLRISSNLPDAITGQLLIHNTSGQQVWKNRLDLEQGQAERMLTLPALTKGVYLVSFLHDGSYKSEKLMVE